METLDHVLVEEDGDRVISSSRRRRFEAWAFVGASLLLTALYARAQLVPTLGFIGQLMLLLLGRAGIDFPALPG
jgi:hypothetical protein